MSFALLSELKNYSSSKFALDFTASLTVLVILIPQAMAYSMLAGMDPIYGLYAALVPLLVYPLFSSSKYLSIGPVALMSIIVLGGVSAFANPGSPEYTQLVILTSFLAGCIQIAFSFLKFGNLTSFLSKPVMSGFITAAAFIIIISQIKYLTSIEIANKQSILEMLKDIGNGLSETNIISLGLGIGSIISILLFKKIHNSIPAALIVVIVGSILVKVFELEGKDVPILGDLPKGLPSFSLSFLSLSYISKLLPISFIVALIGFVGSFSISKSLGSNKDQQAILPNRELFALGIAKVFGSFFSAMPSTGSFSRSAINYSAGARTQVSSILTGIMIMLILLFLGQVFYYLPEPILAGIVITSVFSLLDLKQAKALFYLDKKDFTVFVITLLATLFMGISAGLIIGILASFIDHMIRASTPDYAKLGKLPHSSIYRNVERFPEAKINEKILILRFSQNLYFANARMMVDAIEKEIEENQQVEYIVISFPSHTKPDATATAELFHLADFCSSQNLQLIFTDITGPLRDYMQKTKFYQTIGKSFFFLTVEDAIDAIENGSVGQIKSIDYSGQTNYTNKNPFKSIRYWE